MASRTDSEGKQAYIAEMMSQANEFLEYMPWLESNERGGHEFVFRTSIPAGSWRQINQGVPYGKSTTAKARIGVGSLEDFSQVDIILAEDTGDPATFRKNEDVAFLEGMGQTIIQTFFYGNTAVNPAEFMGFSTFYNTVNTATAANAANVIDAGGVGSSNLSIYLICFGERTVFGVYPRGSKAGLDMKDFGIDQRAYDSIGNPFVAYTTWFRQQAALCPQDWRYVARIANVDVTNAGLAGPNAPDLFALLAQAAYLPPTLGRLSSGITKTDAPNDPSPSIRPVIFTNRTGRHWLDVQSIRDRNVLLSPDQSAGVVNESWRNVPIAVVDQLTTTESRVV